jgi:hypothetical protein
VHRKCESCGTTKLDAFFAPLVAAEEQAKVVYSQWKVLEVEKLIKKRGSVEPVRKKVKALRLVTITCTRRELVADLVAATSQFSAHLFRAAWQQEQFKLSKLNMPPKSAIIVADFAENYACSMQNEVQSYHWVQTQVTIHPVMAFVNASDECSPEPTHTEAVFCITDDPKHDAAAVHHFMQRTNLYLRKKHSINAEMMFSDCCASQYMYRGKYSFADLSYAKEDHGIELTRHYFESSHGKSAADGLAAIVKHSATMAVTRGQTTIRNAEEFHQFCTSNLQQVGHNIFPSRAEAYKSASRNSSWSYHPI